MEKYIKYNTDELNILKESYKAKINSKIENYWINVVNEKYGIYLGNIIFKIGFALSVLGLIPSLIILILLRFQYNSNLVSILDIFPYFIYPFIISFLGMFLLTTLDDGTSEMKKKLETINLVLEKKIDSGKQIMIDTNIIDDIKSGKITRKLIEDAKSKGYRFYITHVQMDEINDIKNEELRKKMSNFLILLSPNMVNTTSTIEGLSRMGFSELGDGEIIKEITKTKSNTKKFKDALIAETSIKKNFILLTNDDKLRADVTKLDGKTMTIGEFKNYLSD